MTDPGWTRACISTTNCIEARPATGCVLSPTCVHPEHDEPLILLRDSAYPGHSMRVRRTDFTALVEAAKRGELDHLTDTPEPAQ